MISTMGPTYVLMVSAIPSSAKYEKINDWKSLAPIVITNSIDVNIAVQGVTISASPMISLVSSCSMKISRIANKIWKVIMF